MSYFVHAYISYSFTMNTKGNSSINFGNGKDTLSFLVSVITREFDQDSEDFKLDLIMKLNFQAYAEEIAEISNAATMELNIENGLKTIRELWKNTTYEMQHHKGDMYKIKNVEDVSQVCFNSIVCLD